MEDSSGKWPASWVTMHMEELMLQHQVSSLNHWRQAPTMSYRVNITCNKCASECAKADANTCCAHVFPSNKLLFMRDVSMSMTLCPCVLFVRDVAVHFGHFDAVARQQRKPPRRLSSPSLSLAPFHPLSDVHQSDDPAVALNEKPIICGRHEKCQHNACNRYPCRAVVYVLDWSAMVMVAVGACWCDKEHSAAQPTYIMYDGWIQKCLRHCAMGRRRRNRSQWLCNSRVPSGK